VHIVLTDVLACPRCGPEFGLIVLSDRLEERRVMEGRLGCPNCRESFPIAGGRPEFSTSADEEPFPRADGECSEEEAFRICALLGVAEGPALLLLAGPAAACAPLVAATVPHVEVVAVASGSAGQTEREGVSRVGAALPLPFRTGSMQGVALGAPASPGALAELMRLTAPGRRLAVMRATSETAPALVERGFEILLDQEGVVVASAPAHG
jgi:uncharacterized protein YbaR (Trm112 family)